MGATPIHLPYVIRRQRENLLQPPPPRPLALSSPPCSICHHPQALSCPAALISSRCPAALLSSRCPAALLSFRCPIALLSSRCPAALSSLPCFVIVPMLCYCPHALLSSPCSVIVPRLCYRPHALLSSLGSVIVPPRDKGVYPESFSPRHFLGSIIQSFFIIFASSPCPVQLKGKKSASNEC